MSRKDSSDEITSLRARSENSPEPRAYPGEHQLVFEIRDPFEFGFGGLHAYLERGVGSCPRPDVLVVRLQRVRFIDAVGIRAIMHSANWCRHRGCKLVLAGARDEIRLSIEQSGIAGEFIPDLDVVEI